MYCNSQSPDGSKFCTECGAALPVEAAAVSSNDAASAAPQPPNQAQGYQQPAIQQQPAYQQQQIAQQADYQQQYQQPYGQAQPAYAATQQVNDSGSIGWGILGFLFPIVGLVLFLVWKNTKPRCAKVAGIGALISVCINFAFMFFGGVAGAIS